MSLRVDPALIGEDAAKALLELSSDDLQMHPTSFYRAGTEPLAATGLLEPTQDYVLLRAITKLEVNRNPELGIKLVGGDRLRETFCFEIVKVGPIVRETQKRRWFRRFVNVLARQDSGVGMVRITYPYGSLDSLRPGHHVQCIASAADFMDPAGDGLHMLVRACFLPVAWDPEKARPAVIEVVGETNAYVRAQRDVEDAALAAIAAEREAELAKMIPEDDEDDGPKAPMLIIPPHMRSAG